MPWAEEQDVRKAPLKRGTRRSVTDHNFGARNGGGEKCLDILLDRDSPHVQQQRSRHQGEKWIWRHAGME